MKAEGQTSASPVVMIAFCPVVFQDGMQSKHFILHVSSLVGPLCPLERKLQVNISATLFCLQFLEQTNSIRTARRLEKGQAGNNVTRESRYKKGGEWVL